MTKKRKKPRVLVVDDEEQNLVIFKTSFRRELKVSTASSAKAAIELIESQDEPFPVIVTDQKMPEMTGVDLLVRVRERWPDSIRMVLTAYTDVDSIIDAINRGNVYKFIYKPWDREELLRTILNAVETFELRQRNKALTEELLRAERLATVGRIVSGLAHEIGNQLCTSAISEAILKRYQDDSFLATQIGIIRNSLNMIHQMVSEIRDFSQSKNQDLSLQPSRLGGIVREALGLLQYDETVKKCEIEAEIDDLVEARVHQGKIQQVVINLLKNAAQAIPADRSGKIGVEVRQFESSVILRISDNGQGIPNKIREEIWEPFFTTKEETGTGLGLDICKQIIEAHGGSIVCESEEGVGTSFEVTIPALTEPERPPLEAC